MKWPHPCSIDIMLIMLLGVAFTHCTVRDEDVGTTFDFRLHTLLLCSCVIRVVCQRDKQFKLAACNHRTTYHDVQFKIAACVQFKVAACNYNITYHDAKITGLGACTSHRNYIIRTNHLGVDSVVGVRPVRSAVESGTVQMHAESHLAVVLFGKRFSSDTEGDGPGTTTTSTTSTTTSSTAKVWGAHPPGSVPCTTENMHGSTWEFEENDYLIHGKFDEDKDKPMTQFDVFMLHFINVLGLKHLQFDVHTQCLAARVRERERERECVCVCVVRAPTQHVRVQNE